MAKRMLVMLAVTLLLIAALGFVKFKQIQTAIAEGAAFQPPPEAVTTIVASQHEWPVTLPAIGTMAAVQGVTVAADLPGIIDRIAFDSGKWVNRGDVLAHLDTRQEQAQLAAAEAQRELTRVNYERMQALVGEDAVSRAEYDRAAAEFKQAEARIGEIRATIERKTIRAPFAGILGIREVNLGQYLAGGDPIVPLQALNPIYVNFGVPQQEAGAIRMGRPLRIRADDLGGAEFTGRVTAVNSVVDSATRNVQVQATLANPEGKLRPGMFVQTELMLGSSQSVITVPATAISYAPYGDSIFIVEDLKDQNGKAYRGVRQQVIKLGSARGDQIAVLSGVKPGEEVVTSGVFKLRNGAAVTVNNKVQPGNSQTPTPEDS
jgi:membrane fusion protein (multidrug efflux system)